MERTLTCSRYDDTWCDQTDDCLTEWCAGCLLHGVEQERARADAAEQAIRGHCALLTGGTVHTSNVTDCLGHVHQRFTALEAENAALREFCQRIVTATTAKEGAGVCADLEAYLETKP